MNMPGMDGLTLGIELRRLYPNVKLSMMRANVQEATRVKAEAASVGFIGKPVTEGKVVRFLEKGA